MRYLIIVLMVSCSISINAQVVNLWPISKTTPNHVYPVWMNINKLLINIGEKEVSNWSELGSEKSLKTEIFKDKSPRDVLVHLVKFRKLLNKLLLKHKLPKVDESNISRGQKMNPYTVFYNSLHVLDSVCQWEEKRYGNVTSFNQYYRLEIQRNKIPSNVFALVDKAIKRLKIITNL